MNLKKRRKNSLKKNQRRKKENPERPNGAKLGAGPEADQGAGLGADQGLGAGKGTGAPVVTDTVTEAGNVVIGAETEARAEIEDTKVEAKEDTGVAVGAGTDTAPAPTHRNTIVEDTTVRSETVVNRSNSSKNC